MLVLYYERFVWDNCSGLTKTSRRVTINMNRSFRAVSKLVCLFRSDGEAVQTVDGCASWLKTVLN